MPSSDHGYAGEASHALILPAPEKGRRFRPVVRPSTVVDAHGNNVSGAFAVRSVRATPGKALLLWHGGRLISGLVGLSQRHPKSDLTTTGHLLVTSPAGPAWMRAPIFTRGPLARPPFPRYSLRPWASYQRPRQCTLTSLRACGICSIWSIHAAVVDPEMAFHE